MSKKIKALTKTKKKKSDQIKYANPRMRKFVLEMATGKSIQEAGKAAGYSPNYYNSGRIYQMMKESNSFKELIESMATHSVSLVKNLYRANLLPRAFKIDEKLLDEFERNPQLAMKNPQALTRIHKVAGTLTEEQPLIQHVNIGVLNQLQITQENLLEGLVADKSRESGFEDENEVIEAEGKVVR